MIKDMPFFSIIIPVKNEAAVIGGCLESLMRLDYPKEHFEIIIADGLSTDNTIEIAKGFNVKVVRNERQIVVSGRNAGFKEAAGDIIVFTDADCIFDSSWLKNSVKYFADDTAGGVGGITLAPQDASHFEKAIDFLFFLAEFFRSTSHRKYLSSARKVKDLPGCNVMYRREALSKIMPVDENLLTAEDAWMNFCLRKAGYNLIQAPDVIVWHHRRNSAKKFLKQVYRFAIGRLQAGKRNFELLNIFHIFAGLGIPLLLCAGIFFYFSGSAGLFLKTLLALLISFALLSLFKTRSPAVSIHMPLVIVLFIVAWSGGFLRELFFPLNDVKGR